MSSNTWRDISSSQTKVAILLEQLGGYCELRLNINRPKPGRPYDAGHTVIVPPDMPIWGYSDSSKITKDLRLSFDTDVPAAILGADLVFSKANTPIMMLHDERGTCDIVQGNSGSMFFDSDRSS